MRDLKFFAEGFLDGFTMAGLQGLVHPAAPKPLLAPENDDALGGHVVSFAISEPETGRVQVRGDLHRLSLGALESIMLTPADERNSRLTKEPVVSGSNV